MSAEELPVTPAQPPRQPAERHAAPDVGPQGLTLASVSRDGRRMLFVDAAGKEFTVDIDERLRAALPADSPRRSEPPVTNPPSSTLRPRDIQNRIRSGESAEQVAEAAGTTVEKIMPFAAPVLAEREHMAERAQKASVRRRAGDPVGTARTLGDAVAGQIRTLDLDPEVLSWDSYRRGDGRWKLTAEFVTPARSGIAELTFDPAGNYVSLDNDDARWLVGDRLPQPAPEPVQDDLEEARQRRAQQPPAEAALPPTAPPPAPIAGPIGDPVSATEDTLETPLEVDTPVEAYLFDDPVAPRTRRDESTPEPQSEKAEPPAQTAEEQPPARPARRTSRRKRASVPSWDEIMFGGGKSE